MSPCKEEETELSFDLLYSTPIVCQHKKTHIVRSSAVFKFSFCKVDVISGAVAVSFIIFGMRAENLADLTLDLAPL